MQRNLRRDASDCGQTLYDLRVVRWFIGDNQRFAPTGILLFSDLTMSSGAGPTFTCNVAVAASANTV